LEISTYNANGRRPFDAFKNYFKKMLEINTCQITIHEPITNEALLLYVHWNK
jgi:hypothetical protein